ncbi:TrmH family RNA methyltransferase [Fructilactobacillus florum]|nr:RNA methyltransferase [Fructilactobacillus florum]
MNRIDSKKNPTVKAIKKLTTPAGRKKANQYLLESWHLVGEALQHLPTTQINLILATDQQLLQHQAALHDKNVTVISNEVAKELGATSTPQGIFAVVNIPKQRQFPQSLQGAWLLLDDVQDPGNIGTMVRTADAAGFTGVIFGDGTASQYNDKVLRAMQGSQFHLQLFRTDLLPLVKRLHQQNFPVFGTALDPNAQNYCDVQPISDFALVMGNEGNGMQPELLRQTTNNLYIPITGQAESLNVAVAAAILMFQLHQT